MSDEPDNLVLVYLRRMDPKLDRLSEDVQDLKHRVTSVELTLARLHDDISGIRADYAGTQVRLERTDGRLGCVERRLDFQDA